MGPALTTTLEREVLPPHRRSVEQRQRPSHASENADSGRSGLVSEPPSALSPAVDASRRVGRGELLFSLNRVLVLLWLVHQLYTLFVHLFLFCVKT